MHPILVALADDHVLFRKGVVSLLGQAEGFEVAAEAANGNELSEALSRLPQLPDVCILDVNMPGRNGYDTLLALRKAYPALRFLILSMLGHEQLVLRMLRGGATGYLLKEDSPDNLLQAIRTVAAGGYYYSEPISGKVISSALRYGSQEAIASAREQEFLRHCCSDRTYKEIAVLMNLSVRTVEGYRDALFTRLDLRTRTSLALFALQMGLINLD